MRRSPLHCGIIEPARGPIRERVFPSRLTGFTRAPASTVLQLSNASWRSVVKGGNLSVSDSEGMALLMGFRRSSRRFDL
ncbi:MAG: hypothetical protein U1F52_04505 [Burkholderiales bacterium]